MPNLNPVTIILALLLIIPILKGAFMKISEQGIRLSLWSWLESLVFLLVLFLSLYITRKIFFDHSGGVFAQVYYWIPANVRAELYGWDVVIYAISVPLLSALLTAIIRPLSGLINRVILVRLASQMYSLIISGGYIFKVTIGAVLQVPRAAFTAFVVGLALNFWVYYFPSSFLSAWTNNSSLYQTVYRQAVSPVLNSNLAEKVPVIVNDSFARTAARIFPGAGDSADLSEAEQSLRQFRQDRIIEYFNGVTLDEAIQSNTDIDNTAKSIVGNEESSTRKALLIYQWLTKNIVYDYYKAARIAHNPSGFKSGSIVTFNTRKGICFDYSSLYVSMCRAVGLKVRLITGLGYSGLNWGDHAWNQVFSWEEGRWINVDATFGCNGNYFDKPDFSVDHRLAQIQGEW